MSTIYAMPSHRLQQTAKGRPSRCGAQRVLSRLIAGNVSLPSIPTLSGRLLQAAAGIALLAAASCAQLPATASVAVPPIPAGEARVWFYREEGPYESQQRPSVRVNDAVVGEMDPRGAFYRDMAPGRYHVAVDSYIPNPNAVRDIDLVSGQQVYLKIVAEDYPMAGSGMSSDVGGTRPVFQVWLMPAGWAQGEIARSPFYGSR